MKIPLQGGIFEYKKLFEELCRKLIFTDEEVPTLKHRHLRKVTDL